MQHFNQYIKPLITLVLQLALVCMLFVLINPFNVFMPSSIEMTIMVLFAVCISIFLAAFWKEQASDERDVVHQMFAGRVAFMFGIGVLSIGVVVQVMQHTLDVWLPSVLIAMLASKFIARWYAERRM